MAAYGEYLLAAVIPDHLLGRVVSAFRLLGNGAAPIGAALGGVIASALGLRAPLVLAPILLAVAFALLAAPLFASPAAGDAVPRGEAGPVREPGDLADFDQ